MRSLQQLEDAPASVGKFPLLSFAFPRGNNAQQNRSMYDYVNDVILTIKNNYENPYILTGGDINRREHTQLTRDYADISLIKTGPTRVGAVLEMFFGNFNSTIVDKGTLEPIQSDDDIASDHRTVFVKFRILWI